MLCLGKLALSKAVHKHPKFLISLIKYILNVSQRAGFGKYYLANEGRSCIFGGRCWMAGTMFGICQFLIIGDRRWIKNDCTKIYKGSRAFA